jgi:hypothetical protein
MGKKGFAKYGQSTIRRSASPKPIDTAVKLLIEEFLLKQKEKDALPGKRKPKKIIAKIRR